MDVPLLVIKNYICISVSTGEQLETTKGEVGGEDNGAVQEDGQFHTKEKR
jgi:hypothetical protein